jgi:hypothetical protein
MILFFELIDFFFFDVVIVVLFILLEDIFLERKG